MASEARKASNLDITTTLLSNDRVVVLANVSSTPILKTITVPNLSNSLQQKFILNSNLSLSNTASLQSLFGVGAAVISSTRYKYKITSIVNKNINNIAIQYALGGTAVISRHTYTVTSSHAAALQTVSNTTHVFDNKTSAISTPVTVTNSQDSTGVYNLIIDGLIDVTSNGTFNPYIGFTDAPGSLVIQAGSGVEIYPVGSTGSNTSIGWS